MREITAIRTDSLCFQDVVDFCGQQHREHLRLEYKRVPSGTKQIAKTVAAFANTSGGTLIYGVERSQGRLPHSNPSGEQLGGDSRSRILSVCAHGIFPPIVPDVSEFLANPENPKKGFLVVRVPATGLIHTIEEGTGIYIRVVDQSEPVRATLQMIEHLQRRQHAATDLQEKRRERAIEQLTYAVGDKADRGALWVSIGPRVSVDPLFGLHELNDRVGELTVGSEWFRRRCPVDQTLGLHGALDGVYSVAESYPLAGLLDVYGNVTVFAHLLRAHKLDLTICDKDLLSEAPRDTHGEILSIEGRLIVERILATLRASQRVCAATGLVTLVRLRARLAGIRCVPLVRVQPRVFGPFLLGTCPVNDDLEFELECASSEIADDDILLETLSPIVERLLWAWGCLLPEARAFVLDEAEHAHYGGNPCPNPGCQSLKPVNRKLCSRCRASRAVDSVP